MSHVVVKRAFEELIDSWAAVGQVGTGFTFTEGPIWHPIEHYLLFSDMPADVRRRWDQRGGVREVKRPSNKCNGMTYDEELNLIVCEHATSSLVRERPDGQREVIASHFEGYELNSPNDVVVKSDGSIYFSDPWYGRMPVYGVERPRQLGFQGVYRVPPGGGAPELMVERHMFDQPNGLCFSPDEHRLYVNDTVQALIRVFDLSTYGSLMNGRVFASGIVSEREPGLPDGMKCDSHGNVWVTAPGGVWVYAPSGELIGKVRVPELVANLAWGGPDFRTLYMCATIRSIRSRPRWGHVWSPTCDPAPPVRRRGLARSRRHRPHSGPRLCRRRHLLRRKLSRRPSRSAASIRRAARSLSRTCRTTSSWKAAPSPRPARRSTASSRTRLPMPCGWRMRAAAAA
jgi:gluconolactonase